MTFSVDKWKKNGWKIALGGAGVLLLIKFALLPLMLWIRDTASTTRTGISTWWNGIGLPLWAYTVGVPVLILIIAVVLSAMKDGKTGSEKLKKLAELFGAFAKLGLTLAFIAVLAIFIVGPKMFWKGDYHYTPPPVPSGAVQAAPAPWRATESVHMTGQRYARQIDIVVPMGTRDTPIEQWSVPLEINGRRSEFFARADDGRKGTMVIYDGSKVFVVEAGAEPHIGNPRVLRFLSLTNFPLRIRGSME